MLLTNHLNQQATTVCWCWKAVRKDGQVFGFTEHDRALSFDEVIFEPEAGLTSSAIQDTSDLSTDAQDIEGALTSDYITEKGIIAGVWDDCEIYVYLVNWKNVTQRMLVRRGSIGSISRGSYSFVAEVRSFSSGLGDVKGRFYQYFCDARLGDSRCSVDTESSAYQAAGLVTHLLPNNSVIASGDVTSYPDGWFSFGTMKMLSGDSQGSVFTIMHSNLVEGALKIVFFSDNIPTLAVSDTFMLTAGCDKSFTTCKAKFSNALNFRGFPHIPGNAILQRYPKERGTYNGGPVVR